jgi:valyl-tRNA synthetase
VYEKALRLLHPFAPFVTEDLWQRLLGKGNERPVALMVADWPVPAGDPREEVEGRWGDLMAVVRAARTLRAEYRIEPARVVPAAIVAPSADQAAFWREHGGLLGTLPGTRLRPVDVVELGAAADLAARSIAAVAGGVELLIPAEGLFDVEEELRRTEAEIAEARQQVTRLEGSLGRPGFAENAPTEVVERERARLREQRTRLEALERRRETLTRLRQA